MNTTDNTQHRHNRDNIEQESEHIAGVITS